MILTVFLATCKNLICSIYIHDRANAQLFQRFYLVTMVKVFYLNSFVAYKKILTFLRSLASYKANSSKIGSNVDSSLQSAWRIATPLNLLPHPPEFNNFYHYVDSMLFLWQCSRGPCLQGIVAWQRTQPKQFSVMITLPCILCQYTYTTHAHYVSVQT